MDVIEISNGRLTAAFRPMGAEMCSLRDERGVERLWSGDAAFWSGQAPVLFPVAGGLKGDGYYWNGNWYDMPKHGFARRRVFEVLRHRPDEVVFVLRGENAAFAGYPFLYSLKIRYALEDARLRVEYTVRNEGEAPLYYAIGSHEAYACPEGIEEYALTFDEEETLGTQGLEGTLITHDSEPILRGEKTLPLKYEYFTIDALIFLNPKSRGVTLANRQTGERKLRVDFPDCDNLLIWTKPGAPLVCIEPWTCAPDFVDSDQQIALKPGIACVPPGASSVRTHTLTVL